MNNLTLPPEISESLALLQEGKPYNAATFLDQISLFIAYLRHADIQQQKMIRENLHPQYCGRLVGYASQLASRSVRNNSIEDLERALTALALEGIRDDYRNSLAALCLLYDSCKKLNQDPHKLFAEASQIGSEETRQFIRNYLHAGNKDIASMGFKEHQDQDDFDYIPDIT